MEKRKERKGQKNRKRKIYKKISNLLTLTSREKIQPGMEWEGPPEHPSVFNSAPPLLPRLPLIYLVGLGFTFFSFFFFLHVVFYITSLISGFLC